MGCSATNVPRASVLITYGSETGNAQDLAEELGRMLERLRLDPWICPLNDVIFVRALKSSLYPSIC